MSDKEKINFLEALGLKNKYLVQECKLVNKYLGETEIYNCETYVKDAKYESEVGKSIMVLPKNTDSLDLTSAVLDLITQQIVNELQRKIEENKNK